MDQRERKRKFLLVMPLFVLPFVTLLFWSLGGGRAKAEPVTAGRGLNPNLPNAQLDDQSPMDKLSLYLKADNDSVKKMSLLRREGLLQRTDSLRDMDQGYEGLRKNVDNRLPHGYTSSYKDHNAGAARVQQKLDELNRALNSVTDTVRAPGAAKGGPSLADHGELSSAAGDIDRLEKMLAGMSNGTGVSPTLSADPEMAQLNDMLQKILEVQHPEMVKDKLKAASKANQTKVFPVSLTPDEPVNDLLPAAVQPSRDSILPAQDSVRVAPVENPGNRFFEMEDDEVTDQADNVAIAAVIHETQVLVAGATTKIRLEQDIYLHGTRIPRGTFVNGQCRLSGDRLTVQIDDIRYGNSIYPVSLSVYSLDGLEGIHMEGSITADVSKQTANETLQGLQLAALDPSITQQAAAAGIETVKTLVSKKTKLVKLTVKAGHPVLLLNKKDR